MPRILKIAALAAGALLVLLLIIAGIVAATFDPNAYKDKAIALVKEKTGRTLAIPGRITLSFFPKIGAKLGQASLSERAGTAEFAAVDGARVSLALLPLLGKHVVVDRIEIEGLRASLVRQADGSTSIDDLMGKHEAGASAPAEGGGQALDFAIAGIKIANASVHVQDRKAERSFELDHFNMESGEIASGVNSHVSVSGNITLSKPALKTAFTLKSAFLFDPAAQRYAFKDLDARIDGAFAGFDKVGVHAAGSADLDLARENISMDKASLSVSAQHGSRTLEAALETPAFKGALKTFSLPGAGLDFALKDKDMALKGRLEGTIAADIDQQRFGATALQLALDGSNEGLAIAGKFSGSASADLKAGKMGAALKGKLDDSTIDLHLGMRTAPALAYDIALDIDRIDLARYVPKAAPAPAASAQAADSPVDLAFLKPLNAAASVKIGSLKVAGMQASAFAAELRAGRGHFALAPVTATLYGGSMNAALRLDFSSGPAATPRIGFGTKLAGIKLGALLKDAIKKAPIDGTGDVDINVTTQGASVAQLRRALAGQATLRLADGAVSGFNLAQIVRDAKAKIGLAQSGAKTGTAQAADKTDFSELSASLHIAAGVAHNDDLVAKTPLFRLGGAGDIDLGREQIDYLLKCTVVPSLQGQGGPEIAALKGLTVPVRLNGPFTAMHWSIDVQSMIGAAVKSKIEDKVKDKVKDALKGLFGK
jgi:AsmA protein